MHLINQQVQDKAVAVLGELNLCLVMVKAGNHSGAEMGAGDGEFIFGREQSF